VDIAGPIAADGSGAIFEARGPFADADWGGSVSYLVYHARRSVDGWKTSSVFQSSFLPSPGAQYAVTGLSLNLEQAFLSTFEASPPPAPYPNARFYLRSNDSRVVKQVVAFRPSGSPGGADTSSADLSHLVFGALDPLTDDPDELPGAFDAYRVYDYSVADDELRLVSRQPGTNAPFSVPSTIGGIFGNSGSNEGAVSDDGAHIFFTAPRSEFDPDRTIYRRSFGTTTQIASPSRRSEPDPNGRQPRNFELATGDGNRVFFRSVEQLTDNANASGSGVFDGDLYRYDFDADRLIDLSAGTPGSTPAEVRGALGISRSGDRVYFAALGSVTPGDGPGGAADPVEGVPNLYLWEDDGSADGTVRFISALEADPFSANWRWDAAKSSRVSASGRYLVFQSRADLTEYSQNGTNQVYLYDAEANAGSGRLTCVSCGPGLIAPDGDSFVPSYQSTQTGITGGTTGGNLYPITLSEDGSVVFTTRNALVDRDSNGRYDAYLWEGGQPFLLSSGTDSDDSWAFGISLTGSDAFFRTREQLVAQDGDSLVDLYTAHVNGGFAAQQSEPVPSCTGEACKALPVPPPSPKELASVDNQGLGNVKTVNCRRFSSAANRFSSKARRLRRSAARSSRHGHPRRAAQARRRAAKLSKRATRARGKARRCQRNLMGDK